MIAWSSAIADTAMDVNAICTVFIFCVCFAGERYGKRGGDKRLYVFSPLQPARGVLRGKLGWAGEDAPVTPLLRDSAE